MSPKTEKIDSYTQYWEIKDIGLSLDRVYFSNCTGSLNTETVYTGLCCEYWNLKGENMPAYLRSVALEILLVLSLFMFLLKSKWNMWIHKTRKSNNERISTSCLIYPTATTAWIYGNFLHLRYPCNWSYSAVADTLFAFWRGCWIHTHLSAVQHMHWDRWFKKKL